MGNIRSIVNALDYLGVPSCVTSLPQDILQSEKLILPGVGSFYSAMQNLHQLGLIDILNEVVLIKKKPILGICLGMQLLAEEGTEDGQVSGLGWIQGRVIRLQFDNSYYRIPHTGFNTVYFAKKGEDALLNGLGEQADFYFVHSFHMVCSADNDVIGWADYYGRFVAIVRRENIYGTQFHPEKSQANGLRILHNFSQI